jgi:hypothetical protein
VPDFHLERVQRDGRLVLLAQDHPPVFSPFPMRAASDRPSGSRCEMTSKAGATDSTAARACSVVTSGPGCHPLASRPSSPLRISTEPSVPFTRIRCPSRMSRVA